MAKQTRYASSKKSDGELEELSEKLANDLRYHIRTLVRERTNGGEDRWRRLRREICVVFF